MKRQLQSTAVRRPLLLAALLATALSANGVEAAAPASTPAPAPAPELTTATYGDWMVVCMGTGPASRCEGLHSLKNAQGQPAAVLAVGYPAKGQPMRLSLRVPVSVSFASPATVTIGTAEPVTLAYSMCIPQGCFADVALASPAAVARLRETAAGTAVTVRWQDAGANKNELLASFKGLATVLDRLDEKER